MKIAITSKGKPPDSDVDLRFGRAANFIIFDDATGEFSHVDNEQNMNAPQGAGIQAAQTVSDAGADALLTGHCGPKAFRTLKAAGIRVYMAPGGTVAEALELFKSGKLMPAESADVEGHWE